MDIFEFTIVVVGFDLDNEFQNAGLECLDYVAVVGSTGGTTQVDVEIEAESATSAVSRAINDLRGMNVSARRIELDLVNISQIADRLGKNRETVRLWSTGDRRADFPPAFAAVSDSLVWAWADVYGWAVNAGLKVDHYRPIPVNVAEAFTGALAQTFESKSQGWNVGVAARHPETKYATVRATKPSDWATAA